MNGSSNDSVDDKSGIGETITTALRQPFMLRVMLALAATVVVFVGMRLAAPILNPILFALVLALLFGPIYAWLRRHRIPTPLALVIMLVGLILLFLGIAGILGVSIARFSGDIASYTSKLNGQLDDIQSLTKSLGVSKADLHKALSPSALTSALLVIAGVIVINVLAENALSPMLMGRGLSISPTILFIGFIFWAWLLGGPGAFLAAPLTIFLVLMLETFPETRWLAAVMGMGGPGPDAPEPEEQVVEPTKRASVSPE
jgi:predicted PurR-regulated permease PerM